MATKVGIIGATGYGGLELVRILSRHGGAKIEYLASRQEGLGAISDVHPWLKGTCDVPVEPIDVEAMGKRADVVFLSVPHKAAMGYAGGLLERGCRVVDFSADYRLKDISVYEEYYKVKHEDAENLKHAVYGLSEVYAEQIKGARLVSVPGCYPTSVILGAWPVIAEGLVKPSLIADCKSGVSGAGKKAEVAYLFSEVNESVLPYSIGVHRHQPEMEQVLRDACGKDVEVEFAPHLAPMTRGIEATLYFEPTGKVSAEEVGAAFEKYYGKEPFVRLCGGKWRRSGDTTGTNYCDISWGVTRRHVVVESCVDNLVKGAAGAAVECMNLMFGHDRGEGLT